MEDITFFDKEKNIYEEGGGDIGATIL